MVRLMVLAVILALMPATVRAQPAAAESSVSLADLSRQAMAVNARTDGAANAPAIETQPRKDPLWNGIVIGAGLGALIGAFAGDAAFECSECTGFNVPLTFGVIGAGAGAAIGAGVDALLHERTRIPSTKDNRRLTIAPVIGRDVKAVVAFVRF
jgi:hypothetical protein